MIQARPGWAVLEYEREEDHSATASGILIPSQRNQRVMMKGKMHNISADPDHNLPDVIRVGTVVSSEILKTGVQVLFNKHDGVGFVFDDKYFFVIKEELIAAAVVGDNAA